MVRDRIQAYRQTTNEAIMGSASRAHLAAAAAAPRQAHVAWSDPDRQLESEDSVSPGFPSFMPDPAAPRRSRGGREAYLG